MTILELREKRAKAWEAAKAYMLHALSFMPKNDNDMVVLYVYDHFYNSSTVNTNNTIGSQIYSVCQGVFGTCDLANMLKVDGDETNELYMLFHNILCSGTILPMEKNTIPIAANGECLINASVDNRHPVIYYARYNPQTIMNRRTIEEVTLPSRARRTYLKAKNPKVAQSVLDMVSLYLSEGAAEGVRGDIAFAQSCLETGNFAFSGSAVTLDQNNFCGMGVTANGMKGNSFDTPQFGIRAQVQHLKAYASTEPLKNKCIDPRFKYVARGCAEVVEWLGQKENPQRKGWATGAGYGEKILTILKTILATAGGVAPAPIAVPFKVRVSITDLRIRSGPGTNTAATGKFTGAGVFTIIEVKDGPGSTQGWGCLKSGAGWISLNYCTRI